MAGLKKSQSKILFLRGVTPSICETVTAKFNRMLLSDVATVESRDNVTYTPLPQSFDLNTWPSSTNLKCRWCTCNIMATPLFIPGKRISDIISAPFCSFNCARAELAYNSDYASVRWDACEQLCELHRLLTGRRVRHIVASPNKSELLEYGGSLTRAQFIKKIKDLDQIIIK